MRMNKYGFATLLLFFLMTQCSQAQSADQNEVLVQENNWTQRKEDAIGKYLDKEYEEAIQLLKDFPVEDTAWVTANYFYVSANLAAEHHAEAIRAAQQGLSVNPSPFRRSLFDLLASSYADVDKFDSAMLVYQAGAKEFPQYYRFYFGIGLSYKGLKEYDKAMQYLQYAVRLNPYHGLSHYYLGLMCMQNNYIVPAMLSFQMQMLVDDPGDRSLISLTSYEKMAQGGWLVPKDSLYWKMPEGVNNFQDVEKLIRSKIALSDKYKSKVALNYPTVVKQMQLLYEQLQYNAADTGFWMQYYVPYVKEIWSNEHFAATVYQAFAAVNNDDVSKQVKKNLPAITKMAVFAKEYWDKKRSEYWLKQKLVEKSPWFNSNGSLKSLGEYDEKLIHSIGYWQYFNSGPYLNNEGEYDSQGKEQGKWKYYDDFGRLKSVRTAKDGQLEDTSWTYYQNGGMDEYNIIRNGKLNGVSQGNHFTGGISGRVGFKDDKRDGVFEVYYENGRLQKKGTYRLDVPEGKFVEYYDNGALSEEYSYVNGKIDGVYKTWYPNGVLKSEGMIVAGSSNGNWKFYFINGKLEKEGAYKNGAEDGAWKEYNREGVVVRQCSYAAGWVNGEDVFYDDDGKIWSKIVYNKAKMMSYEYYDKTGKVISQGKREGKQISFKSYHPNGVVMREGVYTDEGMSGLWKKWNSLGVLIEEENYVKGVQDGVQKYYHGAGPLKSVFNYTDGQKDGVAKEYYLNGKLFKQAAYRQGEQNGYYFEYFPDGTMSEKYYSVEGISNGELVYFDVNGKRSLSYDYYLGNVQRIIAFDSAGAVLSEADVSSGNAAFKIFGQGKSKPLNMEGKYRYGSIDGLLKEYYADGKLHTTTEYTWGKRNGKRQVFDADGSIRDELWYRDGLLDSVRTIYVGGKKESERLYKRDQQEGLATWYYPNGKIEISGSYADDERDGFFTYYSFNGELRFRLKYEDGFVVSYSYLGPDSNFIAEVPLVQGTGKVKSYFRNGKVSADFSFKNGFYDGEYALYFPDGKLAKKAMYSNSDLHGAYLEYYPDGKIWVEEFYLDDDLNGTCKYYFANGKLREQVQFKFGRKQGVSLSYDAAGKLLKKNNWYNDETID